MGGPSSSPLGELVARADGTAATGAGHVLRQLALAQAWADAGGGATLATAGAAPAVLDRWRHEGFAVADLREAAGRRAAWVVADGYGLGADAVAPWRTQGAGVAQVDDHGTSPAVGAGVVVDQNLGARAEVYDDRGAETLLTGPRYCLLRREHRRPPPRQVERQVGRVLVTLGGSPPPAELARLQRLVTTALPGAEVVTFEPGARVSDVAAVLGSVDLAVTAAGTTTWELLAWGVPALLVSIAPNQDPVLDAVTGADLGLRLPDEGAERQIGAIAADAGRRQALADAGQALIDGDGARRVVVALRAAGARARPVEPGDVELLWHWANDPSTRATAIHQGAISWDDHRAWFEAGLGSPDRSHWIIEVGGRPVGQVRFDGLATRSCAEISVSVDRAQRNLGFGAVVVRAGVTALRRERPGVPVEAVVRPGNAASLRSFDLAGFVVRGTEQRHGVDLVRLGEAGGAPVGGQR